MSDSNKIDVAVPASATPRSPGVQRLSGTKDLIADGVEHTSRLVERSQLSFTRRIFSILHTLAGQHDAVTPLEQAVRLGFNASHLQVRWASRLVRLALDAALEAADPAPEPIDPTTTPTWRAESRPVPLRSDAVGTNPWLWDGFLGVVNGVIGDHLAASGNPLAIEMGFRYGDAYLAPAAIGAQLRDEMSRDANAVDRPLRVVVFVHGLTATESAWALDAERQLGAPDATFGRRLHDTLDYMPVYVRYNSGLHISDNGQRLNTLLDELVDACAVDELVLVAHSMGGLIAHSAAHAAVAGGTARWPARVNHFITLGTPHEGAPLEKFAQLAEDVLASIDVPGTQIPAGVLGARSAGIKDLRHGHLLEEDWRAAEGGLSHKRTPLRRLAGARYHRVVGSVTADPQHPIGQLVGDAMVRQGSAAAETLFGDAVMEVVRLGGVSHVALTSHARVYGLLARWLADAM